MEPTKIVVIGASAGGIKAVSDLVSTLPAGLDTAFFIVIHMSKHSQANIITHRLQQLTGYTCSVPVDGELIKQGYIYLAPADKHMLLKPDMIRLVNGPHENRWRPSIDVLFRSAAAAFDSHVTGIILTGLLDDGTSGMSAIKRCGGVCIVQEPSEAEYDDMPQSVINNVQVDHRVLVQDIAYILADVLSKPGNKIPIPDDIRIETEITERMVSNINDLAKLGEHSNYTCPDCGGGLWRMTHDTVERYRCHTGHVYTAISLLEKQAEQLEESVWISIRMLEERRNLLFNMMAKDKSSSGQVLLDDQKNRVEELGVHIATLKSFLVSMRKNGPADEGYL